jgi:DNA-directed RNA polymerase specialized sigma24 family protein
MKQRIPWPSPRTKEDREMSPLRRIARRTARRTARRQAGAAPPSQAPAESSETAAPAAPAAPEEPAYMAELEQLNQLKAQGILSEEEYAAKKAKILGI